MKKEKEKFYKKKWFTIITLILLTPIGLILLWVNKHWDNKTKKILTAVFSVYLIVFIMSSQQAEEMTTDEPTEQETEESLAKKTKDKEKKKDEPIKKEKADMNIELEVTDTKISEDKVTIKGTTNLLDGAILGYQVKATEDSVKVANNKWEISRSIKELEKDDESGVYDNDGEYNVFITYPPPGKTEEQPKEVFEAYGGKGATKITGGPDFYESEDGSFNSVSFSVDFDKDGIIDPEERKEKEFKEAVNEWDESQKQKMIDHYSEAGIINIMENPRSDFDVVNVYVPNEFKMSDENEKLYYVEEIGPLIVQDLNAHFKKENDIAVYFKYEDESTMASPKMFGGWKIKK